MSALLEQCIRALKHHDATCEYRRRAIALAVSQFDAERLGEWEVDGREIVIEPGRQPSTVRPICDPDEVDNYLAVREVHAVPA